MRRRGPWSILGSEIDRFVFFQRIRVIDDNAVPKVDTLEHFQGIAKIALRPRKAITSILLFQE